MALVKPGILIEDIRGSIGNTTFKKDAAGRTVASQKVTRTTNPSTVRQVAQRSKFSTINVIAALFMTMIRRGFKTLENDNPLLSAYNRFMSYNLKNAFNGDDLVWDDVRFGKGVLGVPAYVNGAITQDSVTDTTIVVSFDLVDDSDGIVKLATDKFFWGLVNIDTGKQLINKVNTRSAGTVTSQFTGVHNSLGSGRVILIGGYVTDAEWAAKGADAYAVMADVDPSLAQSAIVVVTNQLLAFI